MIVVRVELWPLGDKTKARCLGEAEIENVGGDMTTGHYAVRLLKWGAGRRTWKSGKVLDFPRVKLGPWDLLYRALAAVVHGRNPGTERPEAGEPIGTDPDMETCPKCAGEIQYAYGLAAGGCGSYKFCLEDGCGFQAVVKRDEEAELRP